MHIFSATLAAAALLVSGAASIAPASAQSATGQSATGLSAAGKSATGSCSGKLGVSRVVEIDTTGAPGFGFQHYKQYDFLQPGEVVLTFDDGPQTNTTRAILAALKNECVKATFFPTGKQTVALPEILREAVNQGHTVGSHTYWHGRGTPRGKMRPLDKMKLELALDEIERGISAVVLAIGNKAAPFYRYPFLRDSPDTIKHLAKRGIGVFSTDIDSLDFKIRSPKRLTSRLMRKLKKKRKGILLFHDIQRHTAKALPDILKVLKAKGYKIVHLTAKASLTSLPEYDKKIKALFKGRDGMAAGRPMSSVIKTVPQ